MTNWLFIATWTMLATAIVIIGGMIIYAWREIKQREEEFNEELEKEHASSIQDIRNRNASMSLEELVSADILAESDRSKSGRGDSKD